MGHERETGVCDRCGIQRPTEGWRQLPMRFQGHELRMQAGQGAHTPVYLARGPEGGSLKAIKLVPAGAPPALVQTLKARFARQCSHARVLGGYKEIVQALEHGTAGGIPYLMMEGIQGSTLDQLLGKPGDQDPQNPRRPSPMPPQRAVRTLRRIIAAVGRLHQHKLIHRNLKPSNIFIAHSDQGEVKLSDMGDAWLASSADRPDKLVSSPEELSPASAPYMSPELVRGDRVLKPCSDIYSIGVVAHEMVTGALPYQVTEAIVSGPAPEGAPDLSPERWGPFAAGWLKAHLVADRVAVVEARPDLPPSLGDFLAQCLARDPRDRMQSSGELIMQLALIEQELARGQQSAVAVPAAVAPVSGSVPNAAMRPVSPVPIIAPPATGPLGPAGPAAPPGGSLSKVINMAQDRDRLTMEVNQLREALRQTQTDLARTQEQLAAVQAENLRLKQQLGGGQAEPTPAREHDSLRKTGRLPEADSQSSVPAVGAVVPGPMASNPMMKTELEGDLAAKLERAAGAGQPFVEDGARAASRRPATGPQAPADFKGTGPVRPHPPSSGAGSMLQTRFQETIPGAGQRPHPGAGQPAERPADMVDRIIRETSSSSANMARQLKRLEKKTTPHPATPADPSDDDLDMMQTNILEGPIDEVNTSEPTSVVSEDDLLSEMKTRAVERAIPDEHNDTRPDRGGRRKR